MPVNTLLKVLEQLLHKIKANRRREMGVIVEAYTISAFNVPVKRNNLDMYSHD